MPKFEKPKAPAQSAIDAEIAENLKALGVAGGDYRRRPEIVFDALVAGWKSSGRPPSFPELQSATGLSECAVRNGLRKLITEGRVLRVEAGERTGVYIHRVVPAARVR